MKKTTLSKLFALLLAVLMIVPALAACNKPAPAAPAAQEDEDKIEGDYIDLGESGFSLFSMVYSEKTKVLTKTECKNLVAYINETSGANLTIVEDASQLTKREIIVGVVGEIGREDIEKEVAKYNIGQYDYLIKVYGNDLIIALGHNTVSVQAFAFLKERLLYVDKERESISIPADLEYVYHYDNSIDKDGLKKVQIEKKNATELLFTLHPGSELDVSCRLTYTGNGGWRVQTRHNMAAPFSNVGAAQQMAMDLGNKPADIPQPLTYWEDDVNVIVQAPDGTYAVLNKTDFNIKFCNAEGELIRTMTGLNHSITGRLDTLTLYASFTLNDTEAIFGTGERFDSANQRGKSVIVQSGAVADSKENSNVAIPLFSSSTGSGIFVNSNAYMEADIGDTNYNSMKVTLGAGAMDVYVFVTDKITDVIGAYASISGYAASPENWMNGLLICRYDANVDTYDAVKSMIAAMEVYGTPWDGIVIDGWDVHDFSKHEELKAVCDLVHSLGKKIICNVDIGFFPGSFPEGVYEDVSTSGFYLSWTFTYYYSQPTTDGFFTTSTIQTNTTANIPRVDKAGMMLEAPIFTVQPIVNKKDPLLSDPFATEVDGGDRLDTFDDFTYATKTYLDITNPLAVEWFFGDYWTYLVEEIGFDGAKVDSVSLLPDMHGTLNFYDDTVQHGGARQWYSTYFTGLLNKVLAGKNDSGICLATGGGIGSQLNSIVIGGEQSRTTNRLERQITGLLSAGLSGMPFVSYYAGGSFYKNDNVMRADEEAPIFLRGVQFAAFTSTLVVDSTNVRGAEDFAAEGYGYVAELYSLYAKLHAAMAPYLEEYAAEATATGMPLARHLVLMWQDDVNVYDIDDEYMLGDAFLVAPELYGTDTRTVYLPEGTWMDLLTGETYVVGAEGQTVTCNVTLAQIPVFYNVNTTSKTAASVLGDMTLILDLINAVELP
ncbi:MAG: glycoside hydrolase family 31 protein [Clostridia bacterium]|nr:glycoside hydrolase family 31 protein [Clostridia bacterium]